MSEDQKRKFLALLDELVRLDQRYTIREFILVSLLQKHLATDAGVRRPVRHRSYQNVSGPLNFVLSMLCHATGAGETARAELHARLMHGFVRETPALLPVSALGVTPLKAALDELAHLSPLLKKPLLDACVDAVTHDGRLQVAEVELLRAIGDALDCPVPPVVGTPA